MCFTSCGWTPTVAEMNGWRCARVTAARLVSRSHPIVTKCPIPASRARWSIASRSASKRASSIWQWLSISMEFDYSISDWYIPGLMMVLMRNCTGYLLLALLGVCLLAFPSLAATLELHHALGEADQDGHQHSAADLCSWVQSHA